MRLNHFKYIGWSSDDAVKHYLARMSAKIPHFETMEEPELNYIKVRNEEDGCSCSLKVTKLIQLADDQCRRASDCQQLFLWLPLLSHCVFSSELPYNSKAYILCAGNIRSSRILQDDVLMRNRQVLLEKRIHIKLMRLFPRRVLSMHAKWGMLLSVIGKPRGKPSSIEVDQMFP